MRIEVRTCNKVRIMLDVNTVKKQRQIINGEQIYYQVLLTDGQLLALEKEIPNIPLDPTVDIAKNKFLKRLSLSKDKKPNETQKGGSTT